MSNVHAQVHFPHSATPCPMCTYKYTSLTQPHHVQCAHTSTHPSLSHTMSNVHVFMCAMPVAVSCLWSENVCLMSCQTENAEREEELQDLVFGKAGFSCPNIGASGNTSECHNVLSIVNVATLYHL